MVASTNTEAKAFYRIGVPGVPWGDAECAEWKKQTQQQRSYQDDVLSVIEHLKTSFDVEQYGALPHDSERYPLYVVKTRKWKSDNPYVLVLEVFMGTKRRVLWDHCCFCRQKP